MYTHTHTHTCMYVFSVNRCLRFASGSKRE